MLENKDILLPAPKRAGGITLLEALSLRRSGRDFSSVDIDLQVISDLLWAAWGRNRNKGRVAPSSHNSQEVSIYVALPLGTYIYDTDENKLKCVLDEDIRPLCGLQDFVAEAPMNLIFVADLSLLVGKDERSAVETAYVDTGFISQNVYLACAAYGLTNVVRVSIDKEALAAKLSLGDTQIITLSQSLGYPKL